jgi:hypothetical protein
MRELALNEIEAVSGGFGEPHEDGGGTTGINAWASFSNIQYSAAINTAISFSAAPSVRDLYNEWLDSRASTSPSDTDDIVVTGTRLSTEQVLDAMRTWAMYDTLRT